MNNFSKTFTIATIFVGCSIYASDENTVERYVDASGKVTLVERFINHKGQNTTRTAIREENGTFEANETTCYPWCNPSREKLEKPEVIFEELDKKEMEQENKKNPAKAIKGSEN